jgi:lipoprotein-anchoring transpeptidase ErfK/SrfK
MLWGAAAAVALTSTAAVASVVVVKSLGPSAKAYPPGKTLPETAKITLQGGDVLTVLGPGSAKTLRGPGNFEAKQVTLASAASQRGRFGALRASEVAHNPSIWDIDVAQGGKICVADTSKLKLWRADSDAEAKVQIRSADGKAQELTWAAGKALAPWPSAMPVKSGAQYQVEWTDTGETSSLDVVTVKSPPADLVGAAQVLIENGCQAQLNLLVESASKDQ